MQRSKYQPLQEELAPKHVATDRLCGTDPVFRSKEIWHSDDGTQTYGFWEMTPGILEGARGPETVVILTGRATVELLDRGVSVELGPNDVLVTDRELMRWTVHETVRKFYAVSRTRQEGLAAASV